jgi:hypothetical protein
MGRREVSDNHGRSAPGRGPSGRKSGRADPARALAWAFLAGVVLFQTVNVMRHANWCPGDDSIFTLSTASGRWVGFSEQVRRGDARFYPLAFQEFNLLVWAGNAPRLYYLLQLVKYALALAVVLLSLGEVIRSQQQREGLRAERRSLWALAAAVVAGVFLLQPRMHQIYGHIIYPESMQIVWLSLFAYFGLRGVRTGRWGPFAASFVFGSLSLYYKEPTFAMLAPVAVLGPALQWRRISRAQRVYSFAMLGSIALWMVLYLVLVYTRLIGVDYASAHANSAGRLVAFARLFLDITTIYPAMGALALWRAVKLGRAAWGRRLGQVRPEQLFIDSLLFGSVAYIAAFAVLKMADLRFLPPVNVGFTVAVFYYVCEWMRRGRFAVWGRWKLWGPVVGVLVAWIFLRLGVQVMGFAGLHRFRRGWAPNLRMVSQHSDVPVIYVYPEKDTTEQTGPLKPYFLNAARVCIRLQLPQGATAVRYAYLDMEGRLEGLETLPGLDVEVLQRPPASGEYFLFVPPHVEGFAAAMEERFGLEVVKVSDFGFQDDFVRQIWAPADFAERLASEKDEAGGV